jgi:hypothetical protein
MTDHLIFCINSYSYCQNSTDEEEEDEEDDNNREDEEDF